MIRVQKLVPSSVKLPEEADESYQSGLEVFHQLHCLNLLRKMTHFEYYFVAEPAAFSDLLLRTYTGRFTIT
jgi:hypothetical protein